jgi:hypothetical protein
LREYFAAPLPLKVSVADQQLRKEGGLLLGLQHELSGGTMEKMEMECYNYHVRIKHWCEYDNETSKKSECDKKRWKHSDCLISPYLACARIRKLALQKPILGRKGRHLEHRRARDHVLGRRMHADQRVVVNAQQQLVIVQIRAG